MERVQRFSKINQRAFVWPSTAIRAAKVGTIAQNRQGQRVLLWVFYVADGVKLSVELSDCRVRDRASLHNARGSILKNVMAMQIHMPRQH